MTPVLTVLLFAPELLEFSPEINTELVASVYGFVGGVSQAYLR